LDHREHPGERRRYEIVKASSLELPPHRATAGLPQSRPPEPGIFQSKAGSFPCGGQGVRRGRAPRPAPVSRLASPARCGPIALRRGSCPLSFVRPVEALVLALTAGDLMWHTAAPRVMREAKARAGAAPASAPRRRHGPPVAAHSQAEVQATHARRRFTRIRQAPCPIRSERDALGPRHDRRQRRPLALLLPYQSLRNDWSEPEIAQILRRRRPHAPLLLRRCLRKHLDSPETAPISRRRRRPHAVP